MARSHARVQVSIWQDPDFTRLAPRPQRAYLFLMSQPNISHLGVLPLTLQRWTQAAAGYKVTHLEDDLRVLTAAGFIVVDAASEELLVRSLFRRDGIYKQPNVLRAAAVSAKTIYSSRLRTALLAEVDRVTLDDIPADKVEQTQQLMGTLWAALSEGVAEPLVEGVAEGVADPFPHPPTCAGAYPLPLTPSGKGSLALPDEHPDFPEFYDAFPCHKGRKAAATAYLKARLTTDHAQLVAAALAFRNDPTRDDAFTPHPATWLNQGRWDDEGPARPGSNVVAMTGRVAEGNAILLEAYNRGRSQQPELGA